MSKDIRASLNKAFQDVNNYPYGFSRSGDFSIKESQLLENNGTWLAALADGVITPETDEEQRVLSVIGGSEKPESSLEKVWIKYQSRINRPHVGALSARTVISEEDEPDSDEEPAELDELED